MKTFLKSVLVLGFLAAPYAASAQSIVIDLPRLTWPTENAPVAQGCNDAASLAAPDCVAGQ